LLVGEGVLVASVILSGSEESQEHYSLFPDPSFSLLDRLM